MDLLKKAKEIFIEESSLIEIKECKRVIFVGDTHGEVSVSKKVLRDYIRPGNKVVFLGDYVDRGKYSKENIDFLISKKIKYKHKIYLLQGNHEGYKTVPLFPDDFWKNLSKEDFHNYSETLSFMPLVVIAGNVIALHGALPDTISLKEINKIKSGDNNWMRVTWGDFYEKEKCAILSRPQFGKEYFSKIMKRYNKKILVRSHQAGVPRFLFDKRCITIFSSGNGKLDRNIVIYDMESGKVDIKRI